MAANHPHSRYICFNSSNIVRNGYLSFQLWTDISTLNLLSTTTTFSHLRLQSRLSWKYHVENFFHWDQWIYEEPLSLSPRTHFLFRLKKRFQSADRHGARHDSTGLLTFDQLILRTTKNCHSFIGNLCLKHQNLNFCNFSQFSQFSQYIPVSAAHCELPTRQPREAEYYRWTEEIQSNFAPTLPLQSSSVAQLAGSTCSLIYYFNDNNVITFSSFMFKHTFKLFLVAQQLYIPVCFFSFFFLVHKSHRQTHKLD